MKVSIKKLLLAGSSALLLGAASTSMVFADNHGDTYYANQYRVWSPDDHSPARVKTNRTAYYDYTKSISVGYHTMWAALYDGRDASGGHSYRGYTGSQTKLWNNAVENHGSGIAVRINYRSYSNGSASGYWSPDSI